MKETDNRNYNIISMLAILTFITLLIAAILMIYNFYICDSYACKGFDQADKKYPRGTKKHTITVLEEFCNDGMWPLPFVGAAILTPISLWFIGATISVKNFAILFFVSFATIYFLFSFFIHHYVKPLSKYVIKYLEKLEIDEDVHNNSDDKINKDIDDVDNSAEDVHNNSDDVKINKDIEDK